MNLNEFFESLASNASRNFKIEQLQKHSGNETLREVVRLALDPFTQFYIRKIPQYTQIPNHDISLPEALNQLYLLHSRTITGNAAIEHLRNILSNLPPEKAKVIERIIQKDLKCGVSVSTANAVWSGLIKEYPVMLCSPFEEKLVNKIQFPAYVQLKMDGMRFNAIVRDGKCEFRSRNGKEIQLLGNLEEDFIKMAGEVDCVFDGELLVESEDGSVCDRQTGNGILNKANKGTISDKEAAMVRATVWDLIPYILFESGHCASPYSKRIESLSLLIQKHNPAKVKLVQTDLVNDMETATSIFEGYLAAGQEGIILKDGSGVWEDKRSKTQIKFKGEMECDLKIVAVEEGTGKYAGMLGAIQCESADGVIKVSVGSGFTDQQRKDLWSQNIVDKIAAIKYNMRIKNKAGEESLFLPIVLEVRDDKEVADNSKDIK
jgi:hypothetical protein